MSDLTTYLSDEILEWIKGTSFAAAPAAVYADLLDSGDASILNTIAGSANRQAITFGAITDDGTGRIMSNSTDITFTASAVGSATATQAAIYDAQTGGNQLAVTDLAASKSITSGDEVKFSTGNLTFKID